MTYINKNTSRNIVVQISDCNVLKLADTASHVTRAMSRAGFVKASQKIEYVPAIFKYSAFQYYGRD
ncbi:MAG: hypothetical protein WC312_05290 [Candidatus Omnitrophota bacterium]|jgi:hypothetical protein